MQGRGCRFDPGRLQSRKPPLRRRLRQSANASSAADRLGFMGARSTELGSSDAMARTQRPRTCRRRVVRSKEVSSPRLADCETGKLKNVWLGAYGSPESRELCARERRFRNHVVVAYRANPSGLKPGRVDVAADASPLPHQALPERRRRVITEPRRPDRRSYASHGANRKPALCGLAVWRMSPIAHRARSLAVQFNQPRRRSLPIRAEALIPGASCLAGRRLRSHWSLGQGVRSRRSISHAEVSAGDSESRHVESTSCLPLGNRDDGFPFVESVNTVRRQQEVGETGDRQGWLALVPPEIVTPDLLV